MNQCVELNFSWRFLECDGCGTILRNDELKFAENEIGPQLFLCPHCDDVIGVEDD